MASRRLTNEYRRRIARRLVEQGLKERIEGIAKREQVLAYEAYNELYDADTRKLIAKLPTGWLPTRNAIQVSVTGLNHLSLCFKADERFLEKTGHCALSISDKSPLGKRLVTFYYDKRDLKKAEMELQIEVKAALGRVTTVSSLLSHWPQTRPILEELKLLTPEFKPPAIPVAELNLKLGLTV